MAWDFETDPEYQKKLDWADEFVRAEVEPLDYLFPHEQFIPMDDTKRKIIEALGLRPEDRAMVFADDE